MVQSITSTQQDVASEKQSRDDSRTMPSRLWSAIKARSSAFAATAGRLRYAFSTESLEALDVDKISARLDVENRAEMDGRNNRPDATEVGISGAQKEIVVYFRELQRRSRKKATDLSDRVRKLALDIDVPAVSSRLRDIPPRCENSVLRLIAESQSELNSFAEQEQQQQQYQAALIEKTKQKQQKQEKQTVDQQPISPIVQWLFLFALIGVGALVIAKASIIGFGTDSLKPPSWVIATSSIVVVLSYAVAIIFSSPVLHAERFKQTTHLLGRALGIVLTGAMAFVAAYYIGAVTADPTISARALLDSVIADPNVMGAEIIEWKVFGIVAAIGLMAFVLGYRHDASRAAGGVAPPNISRSRKQRDRLSKRLRQQINAMIDEADAEVTELPKRLKKQINQYSKLVEAAARMPGKLDEYDVALEDGCSVLLDRYRSINNNVRESVSPASFSEHVCFRSEPETNFSTIAEEKSRLDKLNDDIVAIENDTAEVRQKLRDLNARAISTLEEFAAPAS